VALEDEEPQELCDKVSPCRRRTEPMTSHHPLPCYSDRWHMLTAALLSPHGEVPRRCTEHGVLTVWP
jgi:hypothetical protein